MLKDDLESQRRESNEEMWQAQVNVGQMFSQERSRFIDPFLTWMDGTFEIGWTSGSAGLARRENYLSHPRLDSVFFSTE
jgi:hypothetical protein